MNSITGDKLPSVNTKVLVVDFYSDSCPACVAVKDVIGKVENNYDGNVKFFDCNVTNNPKLTKQYMVMGLPTVLFIKDNKVMSQITGLFNKVRFEKTIKGLL